jgi:hypothetical protein
MVCTLLILLVLSFPRPFPVLWWEWGERLKSLPHPIPGNVDRERKAGRESVVRAEPIPDGE